MLKQISQAFKRTFSSIKKALRLPFKKIGRFVDRRPFASFFIVLGALVALIIVSNIIGNPKQVSKPVVAPTKNVSVYRIGSAPTLSVQGQIRKSGVVHITSLTGGVVQRINKNEGDTIYRGQTLLVLSTNYQGGNAAALQRRLSELQRNNLIDIAPMQTDLIQLQRDLADQQNKQLGETDFSKKQKDVANKQLDLQQKTNDLNREMSDIQLQLTQVAEAAMYPSSPFTGKVDKVFVKEGQAVAPGTDLMQISEDVNVDPVTAIAYVPQNVAKKISEADPSIVHIGSDVLKLRPFYISENAVQGLLYGVYFDIPDDYRSAVVEQGFVQIDIPIGEVDTSALIPYIPVDAIYQSKEANFLFVVNKNKAETRKVELGDVYGSYVQVTHGLHDGDEVITDRNVIEGDNIHIIN